MIAIDTNVLLRRLLADDAAQCLKVERALKPHAEILITDVVLAEIVGGPSHALREQRCCLARAE
jgi:predicted nucleic-acid-binding protein